MTELTEGTFVRVIARDKNQGRLGIVVKPDLNEPKPLKDQFYVEVASREPYGGVNRVLYHISELQVANEMDRHG